MKNKNVTASIGVSLPIVKDLLDSGLSLNIGSLELSLNGRNFVLDATTTDYTNGKKAGKKFDFESSLEIDLEVFEEGEEYNYELTEEDLTNENLKAEFYCSDSDVGVDDAFDFNKAEICLVVWVDEKRYEIKNVKLVG